MAEWPPAWRRAVRTVRPAGRRAIAPEEGAILALLGDEPVAVDAMVERSGLAAGLVAAGLTALELRGLARRAPKRLGRATRGRRRSSQDGLSGRGRVAHQGEDHPEVPGPEVRGEGFARPPEGPPEEQARDRRRRRTSSRSTSRCTTKAKTLEDLKKAAKGAKALYVATDPDREGEAIGWHIAQEIGLPPDRVYRVMFNEITEKAVKAAFQKPGRIDQKRVDAQQARRVLDRLVGYKISPLLWERVRRGLSAGRVQSVAVRLVSSGSARSGPSCPRSTGPPRLPGGAVPPEFVATLREKAGRRSCRPPRPRPRPSSPRLGASAFVVKDVVRGERKKNPSPPFITSTLQQDAARKLRFSASKTMMVAQQLYEGVEIGDGGAVGLITYMRTDSPGWRRTPRTRPGTSSPAR